MEHHLTATECHLPYGITQCYLPPDTSEHTPPSPQPVRPVLDLPTTEGWKAELTQVTCCHTEMVYWVTDQNYVSKANERTKVTHNNLNWIHTNDLRCLAQTRPVPPFLPGPQQTKIEPFPFVRLSFEYVCNRFAKAYFLQNTATNNNIDPVLDYSLTTYNSK